MTINMRIASIIAATVFTVGYEEIRSKPELAAQELEHVSGGEKASTKRGFQQNSKIAQYVDELILGVRKVNKDNVVKHREALLAFANGDEGEVFLQIAYQAYLGALTEKSDNDQWFSHLAFSTPLWKKFTTEKRFTIPNRFLLIPEDSIFQGVALEYLKEYEETLYSAHPDTRGRSGPDIYFEAFLPYVSEDLKVANDQSVVLVDYLFQRHPPATLKALLPRTGISEEAQEALLAINSFVQEYFPLNKKKSSSPSDGPTEEQIKELVTLADGVPWWLENYLAEVVRQVADLRSDPIIQSLEKSQNTYVQLSLQAMKLQQAHNSRNNVPRAQVHLDVKRSQWRAEKYGENVQ